MLRIPATPARDHHQHLARKTARADAFLFCRTKLARAYLLAHGIAAEYQTLTDGIRNRAGTGPCPMEAAVREVDLPEEGYRVLTETIRKMKGAS